uniref:Uncharacterized protein n=1 Tax=Globisporangium ultimum (strain ATCC 200006 / CBS 805.95 / DAOM BR144) TaxID=431595 RepID=K3WMU0_GLOUD
MKDGEKEERERHSSIPRAQLPKSVNNVARRPSKSNAYNYYKKLVQDFESLDRELHETEVASQPLATKINHMQLDQEEALHEELVCQQTQWEQEREHRIEEILHKNEEVDALHAKLDDLDAQEMCVLAQIQILQEKQQEEIRTEAYRIHEIVHKRTNLLETELAKGQMDLEFIARVIAKSKAQQQQRGGQAASFNNHDSIHAITEEIQQRKRREFELAADNLNAQLLSFEQEKELLNQKAIDIRTRKQRALQILSTNQQHAIKTFFTSPSPESKPPDAIAAGRPASTLDFSSILEVLNQSGAQIGQLQSARNDQMSARRQMENALRKAQSILESGDKRIEQLQESISKRKQEADTLHIFPASVAYDGRWGIETYPPTKYGVVYFIRGIVFEMVESAITESETKPGQQLLEHNVQRWRATHETVAQEELLEIRAKCPVFLLADIILMYTGHF